MIDAIRGATRGFRLALALFALSVFFALFLMKSRGCRDSSAAPTLNVEIAGCDVVHLAEVGKACDMAGASVLAGARRGSRDGRWLTIAIDTQPDAAVTLRLDGKRVESRPMDPLPAPVEPGVKPDLLDKGARPTMDVEIPEGATELTVTADAGGPESVRRIPLFTLAPSRERDELARAKKLRAENKPEEAERLCNRLTASSDPIVRARATGQLARLARGNDAKRAISLLYAATRMDREANLVSDEIGDGLVLVRDLIAQGDLTAASTELDRLEKPLEEEPVGRALALHHRGLLAEARGDIGGAIALNDQSARVSRRLGLVGHLADVYQKKLVLIARTGHHAKEVVAALKRLPASPGPCQQATQAVNLAWYWLLLYDPRDAEKALWLDEAERELKSAVKLYSGGCTARSELQNALTNLAHVALARGRYDEADDYLTQAAPDRTDAIPAHATDWELTSGRLQLGRGQPAAARYHFEAAVTLSRSVGLRDSFVAALFGLAEVAEALGDADQALEHYAAADAQLKRWSRLVPFGLKQSFFSRGDHELGVRRYLALLAQRAQGSSTAGEEQRRRGSCVARRSRARVRLSAEWQHRIAVAPPDIRDELDAAVHRYAMSLSSEEAAIELNRVAGAIGGAPDERVCDQPAEDEILLVYYPLPEGWVGFAVTSKSTVVRPIDVREEEIKEWQRNAGVSGAAGRVAAEKLLAPFASVLDDAARGRIRFLAAGSLGGVELHRLPWKGRSLGGHFSISYGVDALRSPAPPESGRGALVVAITGENGALHRTQDEARLVARELRAEGFEPIVLVDDDATLEEVQRLLQRRDVVLFHYAGHSVRIARPDAWGSHLTLAHGKEFTIDHVLKLTHVPRWVLLSSCVTDAAGDRGGVAGLGVAPAFVIAGADVAVALVDSPKDDLMLKVMRELYIGHLSLFLRDPATGARDSMNQLQAHGELKSEDLPPLRVLVR